jgi:DnaK suppressor protein
LIDLKAHCVVQRHHRGNRPGVAMRSTLTSGQRALLRAELEQRHLSLSSQLAYHLRGQSRTERAADMAGQDADDAPQRVPEREVAMALTDREQRALEAVSAALKRMQGGTYGVCNDCGVDIPFERLKAEPWALRCVACETKFERQAR